ncbi:hypothetical protein M407DRAFT_244014 [Tulasnella calospora MUT 4182]|uniref:Uncharacterized protein n=1 Tax=Tulasnella calospora MUT 4182 TaxID=1051891 RepID=A0A0C3QI99_9AGAM|nr:hypothetical protein M407DRAFT_244014 [Tulasnella calospora MUT 4182]
MDLSPHVRNRDAAFLKAFIKTREIGEAAVILSRVGRLNGALRKLHGAIAEKFFDFRNWSSNVDLDDSRVRGPIGRNDDQSEAATLQRWSRSRTIRPAPMHTGSE